MHSGTNNKPRQSIPIARSKCPTADWDIVAGGCRRASHMVRLTPHMVVVRAAPSAVEWALVQRSGSGYGKPPLRGSSDPLSRNPVSEKPAFSKSTATCSSLS